MTLAAPYEGILGRISELEKLEPLSGSNKKSQLGLITKVVNNAKSRHLQRMNDEVAKRKSLARPSPDGGHAHSTFTSLPIVERQDILRSLSAEYAADVHAVFERCPSFDSIASIRKVAASYAYLSTYDKKRESRLVFPPSLLHLGSSRAETKSPFCLDSLTMSRSGTWPPSRQKLQAPHLLLRANFQNALFSIARALNCCDLTVISG